MSAPKRCIDETGSVGAIPTESTVVSQYVETPILRTNRELAEKLNEEALKNPQSPYFGKKIGIANGQVVVVADEWREVAGRLRQVEPDPMKCYCFEAGIDYGVVEEIY